MRVSGLVAIVCGMSLVGCGGDDHPGTDEHGLTTTLRGTVVGTGETGDLELQIAGERSSLSTALRGHAAPLPAGAVAATGTITWRQGGTLALTGQAQGTTVTLGGGGYSLEGVWGAEGVAGTYAGPNGAGTFTAAPAE